MIDREKVLAVLRKRFAGAPADQLAAAANAIVGLEDEWEDVTDHVAELWNRLPALVPRQDLCKLADEACQGAEEAYRGVEFMVFRKRARR